MTNIEDQFEIEEWLAICKKAGLQINPATAEVTWWWARVMDPYGVLPHCPEADCVGRQYFARSPEGDVWVSFHNLPQATVHALRKKADNMDDDDDWLF